MKLLTCPVCSRKTHKLVWNKKKGKLLCLDCHGTKSKLSLGIHCFPADGLFLEHVSPQGHRFMSKNEMREFEKRTGTYIDCLH